MARALARVCRSEDSAKSRDERTIRDGDPELRFRDTQLLDVRQRPCVRHPISAQVYRQIVTTKLAFQPDPRGYPPYAGVIKQDGFGDHLRQIDQVIATVHVGNFMREHSLDVCGRHLRAQRNRQDDDRSQRSNDHRHVESQQFNDSER